jgi:hypothetical protein
MAKYGNLEEEEAKFYSRVDEDPYVRHLHENKLQTLDVEHLPTGLVVNFPGFISQFSQTFNSNWQSNDVYGRMDDIAIFQRTTRSISLGFSTIAYSLANAEQNMEAVDRFVQFLYPMYDTISARTYGSANVKAARHMRAVQTYGTKREKQAVVKGIKNRVVKTQDRQRGSTAGKKNTMIDFGGYKGGVLKAPPLLRLKLSNLITNTLKDNPQGILKTGLTGRISNLSVTMDVEAGFFDPNEFLLPKKMDLSFQFDVIHSHKVGWEHVGTTFMGGSEFPLGEQRTERYNQLRDVGRSGRGRR